MSDLAGADQPAVVEARALDGERMDDAERPGQEPHGLRPMHDLDALRLRQFLLPEARLHLRLAAAIDDRHFLGAEELRLDRGIDRRHAAADHNDAATDRQSREVLRLPELGDPGDGIFRPARVLALGAKRVHAGEAHAEEHGVEILLQVGD